MKKSLLAGVAVGVMLVGMNGVACATLVGDTVLAQHYAFSGWYGTGDSTVVIDDSTDLMYPLHASGASFYSVDVNSAEIIITYISDVGWNSWTDFNGVKIRDLNDSSGHVLQGITASSTLLQYNPTWVTFSDHQVNFDWHQLNNINIPAGTIFRAALDFGHGSPVPEPATMLLFGTGLASLAAARRRKKQA